MKVLGVTGPADVGTSTLVRDIVARLSDFGTVGTVQRLPNRPVVEDVSDKRTAGAAVSYGLSSDGEWAATGDRISVSDALDRLAENCEYAVVEGCPNVRIPQVVLGDRDVAGSVLVTAPDPAAVDLDDVVDALRDAEPYESLGSLVARAKRSPDADFSGAIATFTGRVRAKEGDGDARTTRLEFEKYEGIADERLADLEAELESRDGVYEVLLHHRTGVIEDGEDIVFVVVLAGHRGEAFETVQDGINRLKDEVPIFKKEITVADEFWVHENQ